jgi:hypothetical protein
MKRDPNAANHHNRKKIKKHIYKNIRFKQQKNKVPQGKPKIY